MVGKTLGTFRIEEPIREGGMGAIYRATDTATGRVVAVKVLRRALAADRAFLLRFQREVRTLQQVRHPNVVEIYDVGCDDGVHYFAMEYIGASLADLLRNGPMELPRVVQIVAQAARGLEAVHGAGICHRDIKPSNILLTPEGDAKVSDFGIARVSDATRMTQTGTILGTPTYMAPEQVESARVDARADIYSLGVVLYEASIGKPPFEGNTALDILRKHRFQLPEAPKTLNPRLPGALSHLILGMLEKRPAKRPPSMSLVADALEHIGRNLAGATERADAQRPVRELTSTELAERYERSAARVAFWGKRLAALAALVLLAYVAYRVAAHLRRGPADYLREAQALEAKDEGKASAAYRALVRRFPDAPEATEARARLEALRERELERAAEAAAAFTIRAQDRSAAVRAQIAYLHFRRAREEVEAGRIHHARRIYEMVREHFADTAWGPRADERLQQLEASTPLPPEPKARGLRIPSPGPQDVPNEEKKGEPGAHTQGSTRNEKPDG
jgi:hypothetical protein